MKRGVHTRSALPNLLAPRAGCGPDLSCGAGPLHGPSPMHCTGSWPCMPDCAHGPDPLHWAVSSCLPGLEIRQWGSGSIVNC